MYMNLAEKYDRKEFAALYASIVENGNTALKPLAPLSQHPHLRLVPKAGMAKSQQKHHFGLSALGKCILGFVACFSVYAICTGSAALVGDVVGCGAVAYFATQCLDN